MAFRAICCTDLLQGDQVGSIPRSIFLLSLSLIFVTNDNAFWKNYFQNV